MEFETLNQGKLYFSFKRPKNTLLRSPNISFLSLETTTNDSFMHAILSKITKILLSNEDAIRRHKDRQV